MDEKNDYFIYKVDFFNDIDFLDGFVIYGIGEYGKKLIDFLISIGKKNNIKGIIVTNKKDVVDTYEGIPIKEARNFFSLEKAKDKLVVIVAMSLKYQSEVILTLEEQGVRKYYCLTRYVYREIKKRADKRLQVPFEKIDFLVSGFMKCGTTSIDSVLREYEDIYLPVGKETHFFYWFDKVRDAKEKLIVKYFSDIRTGQKVGAVEPSFYANAKEICQYFGRNIKIILLIRNPVNATFSLYKMLNRDGGDIFDEFYQRYGSYHNEMFMKYYEAVVMDERYQFHYDYWIDDFMKYFSREQILVVIFEELVKFPMKEINRILSFIGIQKEYTAERLPLANEGDFVMADLESYKVARRRAKVYYEMNIGSDEETEIMRGGGAITG